MKTAEALVSKETISSIRAAYLKSVSRPMLALVSLGFIGIFIAVVVTGQRLVPHYALVLALPAGLLAAAGFAHPAHDSLRRLARDPLARPGFPCKLSMVQYAALLAGPDSGAARAVLGNGRAAAGVRLSSLSVL